MEYKFSRTALQCSKCQRRFQDEEHYRSALRLSRSTTDATELAREDFCIPCWEALIPESPEQAEIFSWWINQREKMPEKPPTSDPAFLWSLLSHALAGGTLLVGGPPSSEALPADGSAESPVDSAGTADASETESAAPTAYADLTAPLKYLAALGLMRLKQLKLEQTVVDVGVPHLVFTSRKSRGKIMVADPQLASDEFAPLEEHLIALRLRLFETGTLEPEAEPAPE